MLSQKQEFSLDDQTWHRINRRNITHLVGAELLHNLYSRHWPRIATLRFSHSITNYYNGVVESFVPTDEWSFVQRWLSRKFIQQDPLLIREVESVLTNSYDHMEALLEKIDSINLQAINNQELGLLLIDILDLPLGSIYKFNTLPIEIGLHSAIQNLLEKHEKNSAKRNLLFSKLIAPSELTIARKEAVAFGEIVTEGLRQKIDQPKSKDEIYKRIVKHYEEFAPIQCAYGEYPPRLVDYIQRYEHLFDIKFKPLNYKQAITNLKLHRQESLTLLKQLKDKDLSVLCELMSRIGTFRDRNKAELGHTVIRRLEILDEIAVRTGIENDDIDLYLLSEMLELLETGKTVKIRDLENRRQNGVSFERNEFISNQFKSITKTKIKPNKGNTLPGICGSSGKLKSKARIVHSKDDIINFNVGDILVAVGSDFDLLEIMNIAGGMVIEEEGLVSLAPIISREQNKPCLIGVRNATELIHDGDVLELDADNGRLIIKQDATKEKNYG